MTGRNDNAHLSEIMSYLAVSVVGAMNCHQGLMETPCLMMMNRPHGVQAFPRAFAKIALLKS